MSLIDFKKVRDFSAIPNSHRKVRFTADEIDAFGQHGWFCHYCFTTEALTADHILPVSQGGSDHADNLVPACSTCNSSRRNRDYDEFIEIIDAEMAAYCAMLSCGDCL